MHSLSSTTDFFIVATAVAKAYSTETDIEKVPSNSRIVTVLLFHTKLLFLLCQISVSKADPTYKKDKSATS